MGLPWVPTRAKGMLEQAWLIDLGRVPDIGIGFDLLQHQHGIVLLEHVLAIWDLAADSGQHRVIKSLRLCQQHQISTVPILPSALTWASCTIADVSSPLTLLPSWLLKESSKLAECPCTLWRGWPSPKSGPGKALPVVGGLVWLTEPMILRGVWSGLRIDRALNADVGSWLAPTPSRGPSELGRAVSVASPGASSRSGVKGEFGGRVDPSSLSLTSSSESACNCELLQGVDRLNTLEVDIEDITSCLLFRFVDVVYLLNVTHIQASQSEGNHCYISQQRIRQTIVDKRSHEKGKQELRPAHWKTRSERPRPWWVQGRNDHATMRCEQCMSCVAWIAPLWHSWVQGGRSCIKLDHSSLECQRHGVTCHRWKVRVYE